MKLIVGLGNPGERYKGTRHNVGFMVVNELAVEKPWNKNKNYMDSRLRGGNKEREVLLVKPKTFMNESGMVVSKFKNFYKIPLDDLWVIHDDLDLKLGEYKIQKGVGPKVHNGVLSVEESLGSKDFWRVRIGVDGRRRNQLQVPAKGGHGAERSDPSSASLRTAEGSDLPFAGSGADYVLGRFSREEREIIDEVIERVVKELGGML